LPLGRTRGIEPILCRRITSTGEAGDLGGCGAVAQRLRAAGEDSADYSRRATKNIPTISLGRTCLLTRRNPALSSSARRRCSPQSVPSPAPPWPSDTAVQCTAEIAYRKVAIGRDRSVSSLLVP